jgi:hypothetical protein
VEICAREEDDREGEHLAPVSDKLITAMNAILTLPGLEKQWMKLLRRLLMQPVVTFNRKN